MAWADHTYAVNEDLTAPLFNTNVRDNFRTLNPTIWSKVDNWPTVPWSPTTSYTAPLGSTPSVTAPESRAYWVDVTGKMKANPGSSQNLLLILNIAGTNGTAPDDVLEVNLMQSQGGTVNGIQYTATIPKTLTAGQIITLQGRVDVSGPQPLAQGMLSYLMIQLRAQS